MHKNKIPTLLGVGILVIGIATGVFFLQNKQIFKLGANGQIIPKDIRITNIRDDSFTVSWITDKDAVGFLLWGDKGNISQLNNVERDVNTQKFIHNITVKDLEANSTYFFIINSGGFNYDNNSIPWSVRTSLKPIDSPQSNIIYGHVFTQSEAPIEGAIVYVNAGGGTTLSTATLRDGSWSVSLGEILDKSLSSYLKIDEKRTLIEIAVQAGPLGTSSALIYPYSAKPVPPININQVYDFRNMQPENFNQIPKAKINLTFNGN